MKMTVIKEDEHKAVCTVDKIPGELFKFSIVQGRKYKDGTYQYHIFVNLADAYKTLPLTVELVRGQECDAVKRLKEILENGSRYKD